MAQRSEPLNPDPFMSEPTQIEPETEIEIVTESLQIIPGDSAPLERQSPAQGATDSVASGIAKIRFFGERISEEFERMRADDPLKLVAILAGTAFVLGALIRIWRSNHE